MDRSCKNQSENKASNKTQNSKACNSTQSSNSKHPNQYTKGADDKSAKNSSDKECK